MTIDETPRREPGDAHDLTAIRDQLDAAMRIFAAVDLEPLRTAMGRFYEQVASIDLSRFHVRLDAADTGRAPTDAHDVIDAETLARIQTAYHQDLMDAQRRYDDERAEINYRYQDAMRRAYTDATVDDVADTDDETDDAGEA